jgi:hypothetical protein
MTQGLHGAALAYPVPECTVDGQARLSCVVQMDIFIESAPHVFKYSPEGYRGIARPANRTKESDNER